MDADEVTWITDQVAITNFLTAHSKEPLAQHQVRAVLCLDQTLEGCPPEERGLSCLRVVHLIDGHNEMHRFKHAVATLEKLVAEHQRVLVHCRAGRSRSIAVVAGYLMKALGVEAEEALARVRAKREAAIAPELVRLLDALGEGK